MNNNTRVNALDIPKEFKDTYREVNPTKVKYADEFMNEYTQAIDTFLSNNGYPGGSIAPGPLQVPQEIIDKVHSIYKQLYPNNGNAKGGRRRGSRKNRKSRKSRKSRKVKRYTRRR